MSIWYGVLWILSAFMACWSFSLFVRLISETIARRRKRLVSQRTNRAFWLAVILMCVSTAGSVFVATMALYIEREYGNGSGWVSAVGLVGGALGLFAVFLLIWAVVGDHSRGRIRCPRCWYDMSDATGLQCPECGHEAKNEKQFKKARRPRWAFVLAAFMLVAGGVGLGLNERVQDRGYLAIMPDWMMLMGWELFPDDWVYDNGFARYDSRFEARLMGGSFSDTRTHELAEVLFDRMITDRTARWDPKNHAILNAIYISERSTTQSEDGVIVDVWTPNERRLERLFLASAEDILNFLEGSDELATELDLNERDYRFFFNNVNTYALCRYWIGHFDGYWDYHRVGVRMLNLDKDLYQEIHNTLCPLRERAAEVDFSGLLMGNDETRRFWSVQLLMDAGVFDAYLDRYIDLGISVPHENIHEVLFSHAVAIYVLPFDQHIEQIRQLSRTLRYGTSDQKVYVLSLMSTLGQLPGDMFVEEQEELRAARDDLLSAAYDIAFRFRDEGIDRSESALYSFAVNGITGYDRTGKYSFDWIRESILTTGVEPTDIDPNISYNFKYTNERIGYWIENFEDLTRSPNASVRLWIVQSFPERVGSPYDDRLDAILDILVEDKDLVVADEALKKQNVRYTASP